MPMTHPHSEETKRRISDKLKGRKKSEEAKARMRESWKGREPSEAQKAHYWKVGRRHTEESKRRMSATRLGRKHTEAQKRAYERWYYNEDNLCRYRRFVWYPSEYMFPDGTVITMRSSWEVAFAQWLDDQQLTWLYEPSLKLKDGRNYKPDFYVGEWEMYFEIKGWNHNLEKYRLAVEQGHNIMLVTDITDFRLPS